MMRARPFATSRHSPNSSPLIFEDGDFSNAVEQCQDIQHRNEAHRGSPRYLGVLRSLRDSCNVRAGLHERCDHEGLSTISHTRIQARRAVIRHESLPTISGHKPQLIQLLQNLIGNGIKYCEADQPAIEITVTAADENGRQLFKVQDNGIGIPSEATRLRLSAVQTTLEPGSL